MAEEKRRFETEVSRLLHIVANSLYSQKEIFLRELISNASDACDRLRYEALTQPALIADDPEFAVRISVDKKNKMLEIHDNGIGMNRDALISDLGTIARSGTSAYLEEHGDDENADLSTIGQFGVGFYSVFMVAKEVEVISRRAGEDQAWRWVSDGTGDYTISEGDRDGRGTTIRLKLRKGEDEFLDETRLRHIAKNYSDHIALPILIRGDEGDETVNEASALWTRQKKDVSDEQYTEFYRHVGGFGDPWMTLHWHVEGKLEYRNLLFVPSAKPFDLFDPSRKHGLRLYVKRVFITNEAENLVPAWLRFLRGVVDSEDLPLNVSREILQDNPMIARIRAAIVKRVLTELAKKADKKPDEYKVFWENFGPVIKEGLYEDYENREAIQKIARFHSTAGDDDLVSLKDYVDRMKDGQDEIYYISGENLDAVRRSPQLEGFSAKGIEVLLLTDAVDDFWIPSVAEFDGKPFKSATRAGADLDKVSSEDKDDAKAEKEKSFDQGKVDALIAMFRLTLSEEVKDVRVSERLTDSAVCLVSDEGDMDLRIERMLKQHNQLNQSSKRILEVNPHHPLMTSLSESIGKGGAGEKIEDAAWLLLDQARVMEGEQVPDPAAFSRRLNSVMTSSLNG
ncbi:MAG: molecular chaperone HtpG [Pelagibacteraceae bacterium]|nr:molecular chaperone HtpG [Pelagibacteraceae bacterium]PPR10858.1 MAG: Chaperone protein HtpG [Alphaproteobacteria bacterium MarineAlpha11_Bin1]|tara:strand:+ start:36564 stop:38438 length:1875 start_codon:yes stop_codon:yes gene_type:complete